MAQIYIHWMLVSGAGMKALSESQIVIDDENSQLFKLINYINNDEFLKAQIAQIHFKADNEIILYPQMTKQAITFGSYENMELKFKKLMIFYQQILPRKGWNVYKKVNLKYKDQIICD
jgi:cell division protein FtsQ